MFFKNVKTEVKNTAKKTSLFLSYLSLEKKCSHNEHIKKK